MFERRAWQGGASPIGGVVHAPICRRSAHDTDPFEVAQLALNSPKAGPDNSHQLSEVERFPRSLEQEDQNRKPCPTKQP